jgi:flagellar assembly protein FliH
VPFPWGGDAVSAQSPSITATYAAPTAAQLQTATPQARLSEIERDAFAKGYEQGERSGAEAGGRRAEAMLRRMASTLEELASVRQQMIQQAERQMVQIALTIAKRILHREVTLDPDLTVAMARVALDRLGEHSGATIRLHPEDYAAAVGGAEEEWSSEQVTVISDDNISRGGCRIESVFGFVEAGVEAQFEEIEKAVFAGEPTQAMVPSEVKEAVVAEEATAPQE